MSESASPPAFEVADGAADEPRDPFGLDLELRRAGDAGVPLSARSLLARRGRWRAARAGGGPRAADRESLGCAAVRRRHGRHRRRRPAPAGRALSLRPVRRDDRAAGRVLSQDGRRHGVARERAGAAADGRAGPALPRGHLRRGEALQRALPAPPVQRGASHVSPCSSTFPSSRSPSSAPRRSTRSSVGRRASARPSACPTCRSRRSSRSSDCSARCRCPRNGSSTSASPSGSRTGATTPIIRARGEAIRVRRHLQAMVTRLKNRRRSVFFG